MDPWKLEVARDGARGHVHLEAGPGNVAWSIGKLIGLIDEAIDSAAAQLARSAGLWADSSDPFDERDRPAARRRPSSLSARALLEEPDRDHGIGPS